MSSILRGNDSFDSAEHKEHISVPTSYHIYNGEVTATNTVVTNGFSTTLYTGNGTTQSVTTGIDMDTQWGNDASEKFGGLVWMKSRSNALSNVLVDTIRGATNTIYSDSAAAVANVSTLTAFNNNGFTLGTSALTNTLNATYASWNFQTTHRRSGVTNHGKAYTEHYNPFTGFTIISYVGSGVAGHEIPHSLGRKLGFVTVKNLSSIANWEVHYDNTSRLVFNLTNASVSDNYKVSLNDSSTTIEGAAGITIDWNTTTNQYIMYGWANSYLDEDNILIGNYEIGVYQGTGVAGNKVTTRGKPAWVMIKRLDSTGDWLMYDNQRRPTALLRANLSSAEAADGLVVLNSSDFTINNTSAAAVNASGGQYLYMVVYDNDSGSGKSKYPKATDTTNLNINALVPYANGIDTAGNKVSISYKNQTISGLTLTQGKNYLYSKNDGTYGVSTIAPSYGNTNPLTGDFFNTVTQKWYSNANAIITPRTYLDCIVYADHNGQVAYVEELPKTTYFARIETSDNRVVMYLEDYGIQQIQNDKRYVLNNPFGNENYMDCDVRIEILYQGFWGGTGWADNAGTGGSGYGARVHSTSTGIVIRTGSVGVVVGESVGGGAFIGTPVVASAPARIIVTYKGKTRRVTNG